MLTQCRHTLYTFSIATISGCDEGSGNCEQLCTDTEESFVCGCNVCGCNEGYVLDANGFSCNGKYS